jgi:uncharacterized membrane protein
MMPNGDNTISYLVSSTGIDVEAMSYINEAENEVTRIIADGIQIPEAESILQNARDQYTTGDYIRAKTLAILAKDKALNIEAKAVEAMNRINDGKEAIEDAEEDGRTSTLDEAYGYLSSAQESYEKGEYLSASSLAEQAIQVAEESKVTSVVTPLMVLVSLILVGCTVAIVHFRNRDKGEVIQEPKKYTIDLEAIFKENPNLRLDEREILRYIAESGEGVFITDIRERFNLPKSTTWRMMRRFKEADIIETQIMGRETFVRLHQRYLLEGDTMVPLGSSGFLIPLLPENTPDE